MLNALNTYHLTHSTKCKPSNIFASKISTKFNRFCPKNKHRCTKISYYHHYCQLPKSPNHTFTHIMPSPLNTPTSESIPISIFDTAVDINLNDKKYHRVGHLCSHSQTNSLLNTQSPSGSTENFLAQFGRPDDRSDGIFSSASSSSTSDLSTSPTPLVNHQSDQLSSSNASNGSSITNSTSSYTESLSDAMNSLKTNLTLSFNSELKLNDNAPSKFYILF